VITRIPTRGIPETPGAEKPERPAPKRYCPHPIEAFELVKVVEKRNCKGRLFTQKIFRCGACGMEFST